jgi:hypothetical protein
MLLLSNRWLAPTVEGTQSHVLVVMAENGIKVGFWDGTVGVPTGAEPGIRVAKPGYVRSFSGLCDSRSIRPLAVVEYLDAGCTPFRRGASERRPGLLGHGLPCFPPGVSAASDGHVGR